MDGSKGAPAVEELLAHAGWMRSLALAIVGDRDLAEDVVQDAWVAALDRPPAPRTPAGLRAWLASVVANLARSRRRRERARGAVETRAARPEADEGEHEARERMQLQRELADALLELREPYRSAVVWRHIDGLPAEEIARRGGCTPEAARQRVARGLAELRKRLDRPGPGRDARLLVLAAAARAPEAPLLPATLAGAFAMSKTAWSLASLAAAVALAWTAWSALGPPETPDEPALLAQGRLEVPATPLQEPGERLAVEAPAAQASRSPVASPVEVRGARLWVRDRDGVPIEGATIAPSEGAEPWGTTDAEGRFALAPDLHEHPADPIAIVAAHEDFLSAELELVPGEERELVLARKPIVEIELALPASRGGGRPEGPRRAAVFVRETTSGEIVEVQAESNDELAATRLPVGRLERVEGRARGFALSGKAFDLLLEPDTTTRVQVELAEGNQIEGRVIDAVTKEPIAGAIAWAEVMSLGDESIVDRDTTDAGGRFELHGVDMESGFADGIGDYWGVGLRAEADGYQSGPPSTTVFSPDENGRYTTEIELTPSGTKASLHCHVIGGGASPLQLWAVQHDGTILHTSGTGDLELSELSPEEVFLFVSNTDTDDRALACGRAQAILAPGKQAHVEVTLEGGTAALSGRVRDTTGRPMEGAKVRACLMVWLGWIRINVFDWDTQTGEDGTFAFRGLPSGSYGVALVGLPAGWCALEWNWSVELSAGASVSGGELVASECVEVDGWVELGALDPAALRVGARGPEDRDLYVESPVAADATFRLTGLPSVETEIVLLQGEEELCRVPIGARGARGLALRPGP